MPVERRSSPRVPEKGWIVDRRLVKSLWLSAELPLLPTTSPGGRPRGGQVGPANAPDDETVRRSRYFGAHVDKEKVWLVGKGILREKGSLNLALPLDELEKPRFFGPYPELSLNLGVYVDEETGIVLGLGGEAGDFGMNFTQLADKRRKRNSRGAPDEDGVWLAKAPSLQSLIRDGFSFRIPAFDGFQEGCVDRYKACCEFDAKFSLTRLRDRVFVYARANLNETGGGRFVQVTSASRDALLDADKRDSPRWDPFQTIQFADRRSSLPFSSTKSLLLSPEETTTPTTTLPAGAGAAAGGGLPPLMPFLSLPPQCATAKEVLASYQTFRARRENDLYFFPVNPHPLDPELLLALFPLTIDDTCGLVALAVSRDGVRFTSPHPILSSETYRRIGRTFDHPVDGFLASPKDRYHPVPDFVEFLVQINVHDIAGNDTTDYPRRFAKFSFSLKALRAYTEHAKREWEAAFGDDLGAPSRQETRQRWRRS